MPNRLAFRANALRDAREKAGLTQTQLARLIGVAGGERVSRWELGSSTPRAATIGKLAKALGIRVVDLLDGVDGAADLRLLRLEAGYDSRETARRAHLAAATYIRWEAGAFRKMPHDADLTPLASVLGVRLAELKEALEVSRSRRESAD
ncbi:DNA-binding XRE family transcriptional regulator [Branchiibius hedensis]|uniref:DNA-binding transcriptional regulator, XRE-family HTH domain n=1 Tax=Branchiibius hedensis TaxID=672460 RepID=A0A2Y9BNA8_9MICO|nr:helix-turn-helix transcriptional regulator [Branchiibius hedensis]PWJ23355.1 DNA-binding XRE family transcriptional regulator [Branchiibius hedensis]SSA59044.1 DNA-binding transcriptional regulator, XRE-family HTH domain [Branchiibius hedensis]